MNKILFLLFCFLILITACNSVNDSKNTNRILGFKLPTNIREIERNRTSNYNPTGDGTLFIEYSFDDSDTAKLITESLKNGFLKLPIDEQALTDGAIFQYVDRDDTLGYYKLNIDSNGMSYSIGVIDLSKNTIYIYEALY